MDSKASLALLLAFSLLVNASCSCCSERAVPIMPDAWRMGGNNTYYNNYTYYNVTGPDNSTWFLSGTWLLNNATTASSGVNITGALEAMNVSTGLICVGGVCISNWTEAGNASAGNPGGNNRSIQFNYNNAFLGSDALRWYLGDNRLVVSGNGSSFGNNLVVEGYYGNTTFSGNDIKMTRAGANYLSATDALGSLYLGAGGVNGILNIYAGALTDTLRINSHGVGVKTAAAEYELSVAGAIMATENVSSPLLNTSCIVLAGVEACSWVEVNGSSGGGGEVFNGTFNETEGFYVYNSTPFLINFNATLLNETIDARSTGGNSTRYFYNNTAATYDGSQGGYAGLNALCDAEYAGTTVCTLENLLDTINDKALPSDWTGYAWYNTGGSKYPLGASPADDCHGWTSNSASYLGSFWVFGTGYSDAYGAIVNCGESKSIACCKVY